MQNMPKKLGKAFLCRLLESQVNRLRAKNDFKLIAVAGSAGKTSTKLAIAYLLGSARKVMVQQGNYNDRLTVPLVLFGREEPGIYNIFAWLKILRQNRQDLAKPYPYDVAVVELGTDAPGQLEKFAYLRPDLIVVTAVAQEHMEFFENLEAVAKEELSVIKSAKQALLNLDDIPKKYLPESAYAGYGLDSGDYIIAGREVQALSGQKIDFSLPGGKSLSAEVSVLGIQGAKIALAAVAAADLIGLSINQIQAGTKNIKPLAGRMQVLAGQNNSTLLDDTYNAAPLAMSAALDVLQSAEAPQKIAILGSMNELGSGSEAAHRKIGSACDPNKLDFVVTVGSAAKDYLAPAAQKAGCRVASFDNPYDAGNYALKNLQPGALVLAKGSQNGVFAEEALKILLADPADADKLVRQSGYWLKNKERAFPNAPTPT